MVDGVLELWTFVAYHRLDFIGKRNQKENYRLLGKIRWNYSVSFPLISLHCAWYDHEFVPCDILWDDCVAYHLQRSAGGRLPDGRPPAGAIGPNFLGSDTVTFIDKFYGLL